MNVRSGSSAMRWLKGKIMRHMHGMITCREFESFVLDYLDGNLAPRQRKRFEWHLKFCRECREYLAAYRRATELGRAALAGDDDRLPDAVPEDLIRAVLDARDA